MLLLLAGSLLLHCLLGRFCCWLRWLIELLVCCRVRCLARRHCCGCCCCCCSYSHLHSRRPCFAIQHYCLLLLLLGWLLCWWLCLVLHHWLLAAISSMRRFTWCWLLGLRCGLTSGGGG